MEAPPIGSPVDVSSGMTDKRAIRWRRGMELVTVAEPIPSATEGHQSTVSARLRTDTVVMRLVPVDDRTRWQVCGSLTNGFELGGAEGARATLALPASITRADLLRQVDSVQRVSRESRVCRRGATFCISADAI